MYPANAIENMDGAKAACFAVKVRTRGESSVSRMLRQKGFQVLAPTVAGLTRKLEARPRATAALFPGYIFVRLEMRDMLALVTTEGVAYIVRSGKALEPLSTEEEMTIQVLCANPMSLEVCESLAVGQRVTILSGPFEGLHGTLARKGQQDRLIISINSIFSSISVDLDDTVVRACNQEH